MESNKLKMKLKNGVMKFIKNRPNLIIKHLFLILKF